MSTISNFIEVEDEGFIKDPILTKQILDSLTPAQHEYLETTRKPLLNPVTGDMVIPMVTQNEIAKLVINIY